MLKLVDVVNEEGIIVVDRFVSKEQCEELLREMRFTLWSDSVVVKYNGDERSPAYYSNMRKSETSGQVWFTEDTNLILQSVEAKIADLLGLSISHFEEWQATRYQVGGQFDFHVDCGNWERSVAGERKRTFLVYIEAPVMGGETKFRALNKTISAEQGRLVVWNNLLPSGKCNFGMMHAGLPVQRGTKTILVSWERERVYRV